MIDPKKPFPISLAVARFVDRLANLSVSEWESIQGTIGMSGIELTMLEASRNAAVALAVRDLISAEQFDHLYQPFIGLIPLDSLERPANLD